MDQIYKDFGRLFKMHRNKAGYTQDDIASKVGLVRTSITNIEQGRQHVSLQMIYQLADAVGVTPQDLLPNVLLVTKNDSLERTLLITPIDDDVKEWVRKIVSKTDEANDEAKN